MSRAVSLFLAMSVFFATSCSTAGERVLIVTVVGEKTETDPVSELAVVAGSLEKGGQISVDVESARKIDPRFDESYAVTNSEGNFLVTAAILNFIGSRGWTLIQAGEIAFGSQKYYFTKPR